MLVAGGASAQTLKTVKDRGILNCGVGTGLAGFAIADSPIGKVYIWPWMARLKPEEITPAAARDIDRLLGAGQADLLKNGKPWPGYVLGIAEDGTWLYFVSGSG